MAKLPIVDPRSADPTHDLAFFYGGEAVGFIFEDYSQIGEESQTSSTIKITSGGGKYGEQDPNFFEKEIRGLLGGRGSKDLANDNSRYWDGQNIFTLSEHETYPTLQWKVAEGIRTALTSLPGDMKFQPVWGANRWVAVKFTTAAGSTMDADNLAVWLRKRGAPGEMPAQIWTDVANAPGVQVGVAEDTVTTTEVDDVISVLKVFDLSAGGALTAATTYWLVFIADEGDNEGSHWEIGSDADGGASEISADGAAWTTAVYTLYFRVTEADIRAKYIGFEIHGAMFQVSINNDLSASVLYLNGELGKATSGAAGHITDTDKGLSGAWTENQFAGARVKITGGTGRGQDRLIVSNTVAGAIVPSLNWDVAPDGTSIYVIYSIDTFQTFLTGVTGLGAVKNVVVSNNWVYFSQGSGDNIRRMRFDSGAGTPVLAYIDDSTNEADRLILVQDQVDGPSIWRAINDTVTVSRALTKDIATWASDHLDFDTAIPVKDTSYPILNMIEYERNIMIFKANGIFALSNGKITELSTNLDFVKSENTGEGATIHNLFLMFPWADFTVQRLYNISDMSNIGFERGLGLPNNRKGKTVQLASHPVGMLAVVDGGEDNFSSIMFRIDNMKTWHQVFQAPVAGWRVRSMYWQDNPGGRPRLWFDCNGELFYQEWPYRTFSPVEDEGIDFQHEGVVEFADIDANAANLTKYFHALALSTKNLSEKVRIGFDYQVDKNIDTSNWIDVGEFLKSPIAKLPINIGESYRIRIRLRFMTETASVPAKLVASTLQGYIRTPLKRVWRFRTVVDSDQVDKKGGDDFDPSYAYEFLQKAAKQTRSITMKCLFAEMHNVLVIIEPPVTERDSVDTEQQSWSGAFEFTVLEVDDG